MSPRGPAPNTFVRDAILAVVGCGLALALYRSSVDPTFLRIPGMVLYAPLLVVYITLGGETVGPHGPSILLLSAYVVVLGLSAASGAHLVREHAVDRHPTRLVGVTLLAISVTIAALVGLLWTSAVDPIVWMGITLTAGFLLLVLAVGLVVRDRVSGSDSESQ